MHQHTATTATTGLARCVAAGARVPSVHPVRPAFTGVAAGVDPTSADHGTSGRIRTNWLVKTATMANARPTRRGAPPHH